MNRPQALQVLHLDDNSDSHAVETSYWTLVRHAQTRTQDEAAAAREIEELNAAYATLTPVPARMEMVRRSAQPARRPGTAAAATSAAPRPSSDNVIDGILAWLGEEANRVRDRWAERNAEIALICGSVLAMAVFALAAGTGWFVVLACLAVVFVGVWSPWRNEPPGRN